MAAKKPIRRHDASRLPGEMAFWLVLALAIVVGGGSALRGAPALARLLVPSGLMAAEAGSAAPTRDISLPVRVAANGSPYRPQVLTPVASHGFPAWLWDRIRGFRAGKSAPLPPQLPAIAIVIDDVGADVAAAHRAMALPQAVSLSFLPYPDETPALAREAERAGHQILLHMPMEPEGNDDPGPNALTTNLDAHEITRRLDWALARVPGYSGINNHMGSLFTQDRGALVPVMERLADLHVFFLDSRTTPKSVVMPLARMFGVASAGRDVFLDDVETRPAIMAQLAETEARAREEGVAIVIGHPHEVTLTALADWTRQLRGFRLVPVSVAIRMKTEIEAKKISAR